MALLSKIKKAAKKFVSNVKTGAGVVGSAVSKGAASVISSVKKTAKGQAASGGLDYSASNKDPVIQSNLKKAVAKSAATNALIKSGIGSIGDYIPSSKKSSGGSSKGSSSSPGVSSGSSDAPSPLFSKVLGYARNPISPKSSFSSPYSTTLTRASAPTSAGSISLSSPVSMPRSSMGVGTINNAVADAAGMRTQNELALNEGLEGNKTADQLALDRVSAEEKKNKTFLDQFIKDEKREPSLSEYRRDLNKEYGIQAKVAEIDSLTAQYNEVKLAAENQVMAANDKLGTNNFINNQIQQIERNSAPVLNKLSAEINFRTGILTRNEELINQAISDYTAEKKDRWDQFKTFYSIHQDTVDRMESRYKEALSSAEKIAERDYKEQRADKEAVAELALTYTRAGIKLSDTLEQAMEKVQRNPYSLESEAKLASIRASNRSNQPDEPDDNSSDVDTYAQAYLNGELEVTNIPEKYRASAIKKANDIAADAIKNAPAVVEETAPEKEQGIISSIWNSLFGNK